MSPFRNSIYIQAPPWNALILTIILNVHCFDLKIPIFFMMARKRNAATVMLALVNVVGCLLLGFLATLMIGYR